MLYLLLDQKFSRFDILFKYLARYPSRKSVIAEITKISNAIFAPDHWINYKYKTKTNKNNLKTVNIFGNVKIIIKTYLKKNLKYIKYKTYSNFLMIKIVYFLLKIQKYLQRFQIRNTCFTYSFS